MRNSIHDNNYLNAKEKAALFQEVAGLTSYVATNQADQVIIRQNNVIIELLVALHHKIDKIIAKSQEKSDIDKLTGQMAKLKPVEPRPSLRNDMFTITEYKFGARKR